MLSSGERDSSDIPSGSPPLVNVYQLRSNLHVTLNINALVVTH